MGREGELTAQRTQEDLAALVDAQSERLSRLVGDEVARAARDDRPRLLEAAADYWDVQYRAGGAEWANLSLLPPPAGEAPPAAAETVELSADARLPDADPRYHRVVVRVVAERTEGNAASRATVLEQLRRALLAQSKWAPVLDLPDRQVTQKGFDANGNVVNDPLPSALKVAGGSAKGAAERASGAFDPEPATPAAATGQLTGVWIEFEVLSPNRPPALHRRAVYDAFGPGRRAGAGGRAEPVFDEPAKLARSAALVRQVEFLATGQVLPPDFVSNLLVANMLLNGPLAVKALRPPPGADATRHAMTELGNAKPLATPLLAIASGRAAYRGRDVCVDRVNLFALHHTVAAGDGFVPREYTDIIANGVAVRPAAAAGAARQFFARVTQGILETRIEDVALGDRGKLLPVNTAALFETSEAANVRWVTLRKADDPGLADLRFGDRGRDSLQRIRNDLANGYVVVAPVAPVAPVPARGAVRGGGHVGWWRIDPTDGTCVGMGVGGMGASGVNYAALLHWILRAAIFAFHVAVCSKGGQVNLGCVVCAAVFAAAKMEIAAELVAGAAGVVVCDISGGPNDGGGGGIMGAARAVAAAPTKVAATAPAAACAATARPSA